MYFIKVAKPILNEVDKLHMCVRMWQVNRCVPGFLSTVNETNWTPGEGTVSSAQLLLSIFNVVKFKKYK